MTPARCCWCAFFVVVFVNIHHFSETITTPILTTQGDIDECNHFPCEPFGECVDGINDYSCLCKHGFLPTNSSKFCTDVDECQTSDGRSPCLNNGVCQNDIGRFKCACPSTGNNGIEYAGLRCDKLVTIGSYAAVKDLHPKTATIAGGVQITITGTNMGSYPALGARFTSKDMPPLYGYALGPYSTSQTVVVLTPLASSSYINQRLQVLVEFAGPVIQNVSLHFTYAGNPVINDIQPRVQLNTGGILLTVHGNNLNTVADPKMIVTLVTADATRKVTATDAEVTTHISECRTNSSDIMHCQMPNIDLPPKFDDCVNIVDTAVSTLRCGQNTAKFYVGFQLENLPTYRNISKSNPHIKFTLLPPSAAFYHPQEVVTFDPKVTLFLRIEGAGFSKGCSRNDYCITLGDRNCSIETFTDTAITCSPPKQKPQANESSVCANHPGTIPLMAQIGTNRRNIYFVYCVSFIQPEPEPESRMSVGKIIGITCGALSCVIIIVSLIVNKCRNPGSLVDLLDAIGGMVD